MKVVDQCLVMSIHNNTPTKHVEWGKYHHFSFVIQNRKIVEWATNRTASPLRLYGYPSYGKLHSESEAYRRVRGLLDRLKPFDLVNIRLSKKNILRMSKPCKCCIRFLQTVGCRSVTYSTNLGFGRIRL